MTYRLSNNVRNKSCDVIAGEFNAGAGVATVSIRDTVQPANVDDADPGSLLGTLPLSDPAFTNANTVGPLGAGSQPASPGRAYANAVTSDTNADASGTARSFRIKDSSPAIHSDGSCGAGTGDLNFDNNVIVAGGVIAISSMTLTVPA